MRFDKHRAGIESNRYVKEYGLRLWPDLHEAFNPMSYDEARAKDVGVWIDLREAGLGFGRLERHKFYLRSHDMSKSSKRDCITLLLEQLRSVN